MPHADSSHGPSLRPNALRRLARERIGGLAVATAVYVGMAATFLSSAGAGILALSAIPAVLSGSLFGIRVAVVYTLVLIAFDATLAATLAPAARTVFFAGGVLGAAGLVVIAVTAGRLYEIGERLGRSEARLRAVVDASLSAIIGMDLDGRIIDWNPQAEKMFGWSRAEAIGRTVAEAVVPPMLRKAHVDGLERYRRTGAGRVLGRRIELQAAHRTGRVFPIELTISQVAAGDGTFSASIQDLSEVVSQRERLEHLAVYDELTGLPNRVVLRDRVDLAAADAARDGVTYGLLLLELRQLGGGDTAHSRVIADDVLKQVSERMQRLAGRTDTLARVGGDRFALLRVRRVGAKDLHVLAEAMRSTLDAPFPTGDTSVRLTGAVGSAIGPGHGREADALLRSAEVALAAARAAPEGFALFDPAIELETADRRALTEDLRRALEAQELRVEYQPIVDIASGRCLAVEALCRWDHPERGPVPPLQFIQLAEESGLIGPLELWVLEEAIEQCARWEAEGFPLSVAVNIAPAHLDEGGIAEAIATAIRSHSLAAPRVTLEITESALAVDVGTTVHATEAIRALGIRVAIDDFGTGYSSFSLLQRLVIDQLKIDRSFVAAALVDEQSAAIVRTTVDLAHRLGARVVAEGVETQEQLEFLSSTGCDEAQGYLISRPLRPAEIASWLRSRHGWDSRPEGPSPR